ncbi:MAG: LysR family transcriptional regulator [Thiothrix sp.]|nr:LysR family transcriptional regulator [Thiothrix sp.]HPQ97112.1 LysR family transcriptional regulator [Thiolinea sp.]
MSRLDDLFWLAEVVEAGTLSAAAQKNHVTSAAVSKRIRLLEQRLGVALLVRNTRHLRMTEAGELYYRRGKRLLEAFNELEDNVSSTSEYVSGVIRMNAPLSFGMRRLVTPVREFMGRYPAVSISLDLDDRLIDIPHSDYDLVIRIGQLQDSSIVARRISTAPIVCCASPRYLQQQGEPRHPQDLRQHVCLIYEQQPLSWTFQQAGKPIIVPVQGRLQTNNGDFLCALAEQHQGIALLPSFIVDEALAAGRLQLVLADFQPESLNVYAMYPSRQFLPAKIRLLIEFLCRSCGGGE